MPTNTQNDTQAGQSPVLALAHGWAPSAGDAYRNLYDGDGGPTITIAYVNAQEAVCVYRWYDHAKNPLHAFVKTFTEIAAEVEKGKWVLLPNIPVSNTDTNT